MDKNSIIGLVLIFAILFGYQVYTAPTQAEREREIFVQDSIANIEKAKIENTQIKQDSANKITEEIKKDTATIKSILGTSFANAGVGTEAFTTLETDKLKIVFSNKGGSVSSVQLKKFNNYDSTELMLFNKGELSLDYGFATENMPIHTKSLFWKGNIIGNSIEYTITTPEGAELKQIYTLDSSYLVDYKFKLTNFDKITPRNGTKIELNWEGLLKRHESYLTEEKRKSTLYYKYNGETPDNIGETKFKTIPAKGQVKWVSFKQKFFNATLINDGLFERAGTFTTIEPKDDSIEVKKYGTKLYLPYTRQSNADYDMAFYFGPNKFDVLKKQGHQLERLVPLGWKIFGWISRTAIRPLFAWLTTKTGNIGLAILLLTFIIKMLLWPLIYKSTLSTAKMRVLKPELDKLKARLKGDAQKIQVEQMALYRSAGVNPMGGCLPMLVQMPVLLSVFYLFPALIELRHKPFLWASDLSNYDSVYNLGFDIPFYGDHISLFTILMTVSTLIYTHFNNQMSGVNAQMKWMTYLMPVMFLGFFNNYASGLTFYYFVSNIITFSQQAIIRKTMDDDKILAKLEANRKNPKKKKKSKFQQRLEEMQKQQQHAQKQKGKKKK